MTWMAAGPSPAAAHRSASDWHARTTDAAHLVALAGDPLGGTVVGQEVGR